MKKIIINADDYGLSAKFNQGVIELIKKEIISSVTVMINRNFVDNELLKFNDRISIGLHLEIKKEDTDNIIEEQIDGFFNQFGQLPTHLDGHRHCHLEEDNLKRVIELSKKYNMPIRSKFKTDRRRIKFNKIKTPDNFIEWHPKKIEKLFSKLNENKSKVTELVCHPGYYDKNCKYLYNKRREEELEILKSKEFSEILKKYKLINYKRL